MPYRCKDCRQYFSVRKGTVMQSSKIGCQKWVIAIYMPVLARPVLAAGDDADFADANVHKMCRARRRECVAGVNEVPPVGEHDA